MWYLTSESDPRVLYVCPIRRELTIGRSPDHQVCDFAIQDDASISRKHALLTLIDNNGLFLKDLGSRYGTYINGSETVQSNATTELQNNFEVKFGKMKSIWRVHEAKFVTCTSTLKGENLQSMRSVLSKLGADLRNDWDDTCNYLTMPAITLTIKVVLALVQGSYIVTTQFWNKCLEAVENNTELPDPKNYRPDIVESTLNKDIVSFMPDNRRASLFNEKKFVFFSKRQYEMYKAVLVIGAATPMLLSECKLSKSKLCENDVIVIQYNFTSQSQESEAQKNQITDIVNYLKSNGKRVVADPEIGLAVLHCSTAKYCNPSFNFSSEVVKQAPAQPTSKILVQETQEQTNDINKKNVIIDESLSSSIIEGNSSKRKLNEMNDDDLETNVNKKFAANGSKTVIENNKRKNEEESTMPSKKMAANNDDDMFNFITPATNNSNSTQKLNLARPQKRKADFDNEDDLFNFVQEKKSDEDTESSDIYEENKKEAPVAKTKQVTAEEILVMRGAKLDELKNTNWSTNVKRIKKEHDVLNDKNNQLDIGGVIIKINKSLIVKKKVLKIEVQEQTGKLKNFKKFKKVWPTRMQVTVIPKASTTISDYVTQNHEEQNSATY